MLKDHSALCHRITLLWKSKNLNTQKVSSYHAQCTLYLFECVSTEIAMCSFACENPLIWMHEFYLRSIFFAIAMCTVSRHIGMLECTYSVLCLKSPGEENPKQKYKTNLFELLQRVTHSGEGINREKGEPLIIRNIENNKASIGCVCIIYVEHESLLCYHFNCSPQCFILIAWS